MQYLVALAETGHFGRAADLCTVTQSTLSSGIRDLEDALQTRLVDRSRRQMALTAQGHVVAERAKDILAAVDDLVDSTRATRAPLTGPLRLGVIPTIAPFLLPQLLPALRQRFPDLKLYLREDQTARLIDHVESGRLDLLLLALPFPHPGLTMRPLFADPLLLCRRPSEGPAHLEALRGGDLLLLEDGHCLRDHVITACHVPPRGAVDSFQATTLQTLVHMVESGLGQTLLPSMAVDAGMLQGTDLQAVSFEDAAPQREIALAWRPGSGRVEEFEMFAHFLTGLTGLTGSSTVSSVGV